MIKARVEVAPRGLQVCDLAHPDADLIRVCEEHTVNRDNYNRDGGYVAVGDDPLWRAYERTRDAISDAKPKTLERMVAKAFAAKAEALRPNGQEDPEGTPAEHWAWDLVDDILAIGKEGR